MSSLSHPEPESVETRCALLLSGNEAVAQAAADAGVQVATGYPGTPATQIIERLEEMPGNRRVLWHTNEKTALEMAIGAALHPEGRALVAMKHVGLNVAADAFKSVAVTGITGALVLVVCDDPGMHSSQNEFDSRRYAAETATVVLEPADAQESYDFTREALRLSRRLGSLVMLRMTTRVCHARSSVRRGEPAPPITEITPLAHRPWQYVVAPAFSRPNVRRLFDIELPRRRQVSEQFPGNRISGPRRARYGLIVSGVSQSYLADVLDADAARVLKLAMPFPVPLRLVRELADSVDELLVFEEGGAVRDELLRNHIVKIAGSARSYGEWSPEAVREALKGTGLVRATVAAPAPLPDATPPASLCPGCPHRAISFAVKQLGVPLVGDIGCSTLTAFQPLDVMSTALEMGASIPMAEGSHYLRPDSKPICMIGDGTFLHSGVPGLLGAVENGARITVLILDNDGIAMTGQQRIASSRGRRVDLERLVTSLGVEHLETIDAHDYEQCRASLQRAQEAAGVSVIIVRDPCVLAHPRMKSDGALGPRYEVDSDRCTQCGQCLDLGCPSISLSASTGTPMIDDSCVGCGDCIQVCNPCPVQTRVQQFTAAFGANQRRAGAEALYASNPFASACGSLCEAHCRTSAIVPREGPQRGQPQSHGTPFHEIEAQLATYRPSQSPSPPPLPDSQEYGTGHSRIAIVGAGPAGLTAARLLAMKGCRVDIFEASEVAGGLMRHLVAGRSALEARLHDDIQRILDLPTVRIHYRSSLGANRQLVELTRAYDAVLLAFGLQSLQDPIAQAQIEDAMLELGHDGLRNGSGFRVGDKIFAAGDVKQGATKDLAHAVAAGKRSAGEILTWLGNKGAVAARTSLTSPQASRLPRPRLFREACDILIGSLGGQGGVTVGRILAHAFQLAGWQCKTSEIHGLAQRGGPVTIHVRGHRNVVHSPLIERGRAQVGLFLDPTQATRWQHWVADIGVVVLPVAPSGHASAEPTLDDSVAAIRRVRPQLDIASIDAESAGASNGTSGVVLLGYLAHWIGLPDPVWSAAIEAVVPQSARSQNLDAFHRGATHS